MNRVAAVKRLELMVLIRQTELLLSEMATSGLFATPIHLGIGQEAIAVGVSANLRKTDAIYGNHRSHAHFLAAGGKVESLFSEILGKSTGCSGGHGGSMHITDPEIGFMGSMPIVAGTIPIAVGAGYGKKLNSVDQISVIYFGDGATEEGVFHESLNLASQLGIPTLFVCENNSFSSHLHISERQTNSNLIRFAIANGISNFQVDGNNLRQVEKESAALIHDIRTKRTPGFIEAFTYRLYGHVGYQKDEEVGLNRREDLKIWESRDPIASEFQRMTGSMDYSVDEFELMNTRVKASVRASWDKACEQNSPNKLELLHNVFFEVSQ
jgi:TPP-dependent pyruvate/acetoin dehydrogenase alpha subunit